MTQSENAQQVWMLRWKLNRAGEHQRSKQRRHPKVPPVFSEGVEIPYIRRRRRQIAPTPTRVPKSTREEGSGTLLTTCGANSHASTYPSTLAEGTPWLSR